MLLYLLIKGSKIGCLEGSNFRAGGRSKIQPRQEEGCQVGGGGVGAETLKVYVRTKIYPGNCLGCLLGSAGHEFAHRLTACRKSR